MGQKPFMVPQQQKIASSVLARNTGVQEAFHWQRNKLRSEPSNRVGGNFGTF